MQSSRFKAQFVGAAVGGLAALAANACDTETAALRGLLQAEYAFSQQAHTSVRTAFLEYLAEDSLVLQPAPVPGRAFYAAVEDDAGSLEWYPAGADLADSGDLGFTMGPWIYSAAGAQIHGHFLTIWKRDATCRWRIEFDGGVSHATEANAEAKLVPDAASFAKRNAPPPKLIAGDAVSRAISDFQDTARKDGFAAGLRTYARTADFRLYTDGEAPMGVSAANRYMIGHTMAGAWKEDARGRSADSTLGYSVGELSDAHQHSSHAYVQIWQYDPRVASWGLRVLLINPLAPSKEKS
jgi:ketosteroid isomerase-like protein